MYCKVCGKELAEETKICMGCGVPVGRGSGYCPECGQPTEKEAVICVSCGKTLVEPKTEIPADAKSSLVAGLLGIFFGGLGVHNFYLKRTGRAVIQLVLRIVSTICSFFTTYTLLIPFANHSLGVGALTIIGTFIYWSVRIWSIVEAILLLCGSTKVDGCKRPLKK